MAFSNSSAIGMTQEREGTEVRGGGQRSFQLVVATYSNHKASLAAKSFGKEEGKRAPTDRSIALGSVTFST